MNVESKNKDDDYTNETDVRNENGILESKSKDDNTNKSVVQNENDVQNHNDM